MTYSDALAPIPNQSGARVSWTSIEEDAPSDHWTDWRTIWSEVLRTSAVNKFPQGTGSCETYVMFEAVPFSTAHFGTTAKNLLDTIEFAFGRSATNLATILRVSRPMIYHYRKGMEPTAENRRRLLALAEFTSDWISQIDRSFEVDLKTELPEGRSLLDYLSEPELDFGALRRVINRSLEDRRRDRALRQQLADELTRKETLEERRDIVRERHGAGEPVYVGDPQNPGKLIQMLPDGLRIRGRMVNRQFVPDEK